MPGPNLIVFRENHEQISKHRLERDLLASVGGIKSGSSESALHGLILAGQLESTLWDHDCAIADRSSDLTNWLAHAFVTSAPDKHCDVEFLASHILGTLPDPIQLSRPEGFAYYSLHPGDFADAVKDIAAPSAAVIGIRSIGTTLSAVVAAQLELQKIPASRITVRPAGHPYDRRTHFTPAQAAWIEQQQDRGSIFLIVDEGPGLSGSSFLSVGESLLNVGVPADRITLIGTRDCDPARLCAHDGVHRWNQFHWRKVSSRIHSRFEGLVSLSGGAWREFFLNGESPQPPTWKEMESTRFLNQNRTHILKFDGLATFGLCARERSDAVYQAGFGPAVDDAGDGMARYEFIDGYPLETIDMSSSLLDHMAKYCAFRASEFKTARQNDGMLQQMAEFNFGQEFGREIRLPEGSLEIKQAVFVDSRMHPHEWIRARSGEVLKVDAAAHGDDHFLPGPTDISWDLAGAIVEWNLEPDAADYLLARFRALSGDHSDRDRLPAFVLAYAVFRLGHCRMALHATEDASEKTRLEQSCAFYGQKAMRTSASLLYPAHR